ncbi:MAG: PilZ domain-containing protein [Pseudomonadota bacterium]
MTEAASDFRRARRRRVETRVEVVDVMTGEIVGQVANVSENGLLMLARGPMREDALFQLRFSLPSREDGYVPVDVGVHLLWSREATVAGQNWVGARFLSITDDSLQRLRAWVDAPDAVYA